MAKLLFHLLAMALAALIAGCSQPSSTPALSLTPSLFVPSNEPLRSARLIVTNDALWAGHSASRIVTKLTLPTGTQSWQRNVDCEPAAMARDSGKLYVACFDTNSLLVMDEETGSILGKKRVGHGPFGVLAASGRLYITLANDNTLLELDQRSLREIARADTGHQPRGLALRSDRLYVVHLLDASTAVFNAATLQLQGTIEIGQQAALAESITLHPAQPRAYIAHQRMNVTNLTRQFDNTVFPLVSAIDTDALAPIRRESHSLDSADTPVGMPSAVALSLDGSRLYAVNAASDDISVINLATGIGVGHIVVGENPRDIALSPDGRHLYSLNAISGDVSVVDLGSSRVIATLSLAKDPRPGEVHLGERLFRTSRPETVARDHWIACASCHWDAGFDGQTWLGTEGGPRNTTLLRGIAGTAPLHWSADRENVQAFQATFTELMGGKGLSPLELDALAAFLNSLPPLPSPLRQPGGSLPKEASKGAGVFRRAGCAACHNPTDGLFTDRTLHDVGTGAPFHNSPTGTGKVSEALGAAFDTPSLRELWLTAPYLHDGRAATLRDVLTTHNPRGSHGDTGGLSENDLTALETFLRSLPLTNVELKSLFGK